MDNNFENTIAVKRYDRTCKMNFKILVVTLILIVLAFIYVHWIAGLAMTGISMMIWRAGGTESARQRMALPENHPDKL